MKNKPDNFIVNTVISKDGTKIGYRKIGNGKGLIIAHGGGRISQNYEQLAHALADRFTVYIPDRRGRGLSGEEGPGYDLAKAAEDLEAVINATNTSFIFGHSAGGLVALETMLLYPLEKSALYDVPFSFNHSVPTEWFPDFEKALEEKKLKRATAILLKGLQVVEGMNKMPTWSILLLVNILSLFQRGDTKTKMLTLVPTVRADIRMVMEADSKYGRYSSINIPVALMLGSKSPTYFHEGARSMIPLLKRSVTKIFEKLDHSAPEEESEAIANYLKEFYQPDLKHIGDHIESY
ncbi:MAG: alpha/beta fold hydrolase [Bacteroidia bacterium]